MDKTVGIVGLGIMGSAIARNLTERGWQVIGFDIDPAKGAELASKVAIARNVEAVARDSPVIMTSLPTPGAVDSVAKTIAELGTPPSHRDRTLHPHARR